MGKHSVTVALLLTLSVLALPVWGHAPAPVHDCRAPSRPADDQDDVRWQAFLDAVDGFRACISGFAAANHAAADTHRQAANDATMAWNVFVRSDLNVPEDFPWPPEEGSLR